MLRLTLETLAGIGWHLPVPGQCSVPESLLGWDETVPGSDPKICSPEPLERYVRSFRFYLEKRYFKKKRHLPAFVEFSNSNVAFAAILGVARLFVYSAPLSTLAAKTPPFLHPSLSPLVPSFLWTFLCVVLWVLAWKGWEGAPVLPASCEEGAVQVHWSCATKEGGASELLNGWHTFYLRLCSGPRACKILHRSVGVCVVFIRTRVTRLPRGCARA